MKNLFHKAIRVFIKNLFHLAGRLNRSIQPRIFFCIKEGYHHASVSTQFDDTGNKDEWQREVYLAAADLMQQYNFRSVIDVGCGSAYKLVSMLGNYEICGIEVEPTYSWLLRKYPEKNWILFDEAKYALLSADLIICSDVIEHIKNPDELLIFLSSIHFQYLIISTPERDRVAGDNDFGPPRNPAHFREWNAEEFYSYIAKYFEVTDQKIVESASPTQMLICKKLSLHS